MITIIATILVFSQGLIVNPYRFALPPTYLAQQDFEGAGYDNGETWTENVGGGTVDEDSTATVLEGSQSLSLVSSAQTVNTYKTITANSTIYAYAKVRVVSRSGTPRILVVLDGSGNPLSYVTYQADNTLHIRSGTAGGTSTVGTISTGTTYHLRMRYTKGTGANSFASIEFSTTGSFTGSGNNYAEHTSGNATADASRFMCGSNISTTYSLIHDKIRVDDVIIGDNPP
jgi:hypothetical protein